MVDGLTDIVEKTGTLCKLNIGAKLSGQKTGNVSNFDRVIKNILTVAGTILLTTEKLATKHQRAQKQGQEGGIIKVETPIYACKVQLVCPKCGKATRVAHKIADGKKTRVCKKCGAEI